MQIKIAKTAVNKILSVNMISNVQKTEKAHEEVPLQC